MLELPRPVKSEAVCDGDLDELILGRMSPVKMSSEMSLDELFLVIVLIFFAGLIFFFAFAFFFEF